MSFAHKLVNLSLAVMSGRHLEAWHFHFYQKGEVLCSLKAKSDILQCVHLSLHMTTLGFPCVGTSCRTCTLLNGPWRLFVMNDVTLFSTCCRTFAAKVMLDTCYQTGSVVAAGMTVSTVVLISAHSYHNIGISVYVAVPGRNLTLFRCVFRSHCCVRSALAWNFR